MSKAIGRDNSYREMTDKIIAELEQGIVPWVQPWSSSQQLSPLGLPVNGLTRRSYSGINILLLWSTLEEKSFASPYWLTFKQCIAMGSSVRKGEHGTHVYFADKFVPQNEKQRAKDEGTDPSAIHFLKRYTVFNAGQCEGLPVGLFGKVEPRQPREIVPEAEALIGATGADFRVGGDQAFYVPSEDFIRIPNQTSYTDQINYYRTAFHELGHWTGHKTRLDRSLTTKFGTVDYAREELVAEMATAFVCASLGIVPTVRHADYIGNWLAVLKEDARAIVKAASLASKACDFILQFKAASPIRHPIRGAGGMTAAAPIPFETEATSLGQQVLVPGVRPVSMKARLEVLAAHPLGSNRLQRPCDIGLFDDVARNQMELFSANPPTQKD